MMTPSDIILKYRLTEKATQQSSLLNQYVFEVALTAKRKQVAWAISKLFDVEVTRVNIINTKGKPKRNRGGKGPRGYTPRLKKAVVTLATDNSISFV